MQAIVINRFSFQKCHDATLRGPHSTSFSHHYADAGPARAASIIAQNIG
jgi:hypothetical protein